MRNAKRDYKMREQTPSKVRLKGAWGKEYVGLSMKDNHITIFVISSLTSSGQGDLHELFSRGFSNQRQNTRA